MLGDNKCSGEKLSGGKWPLDSGSWGMGCSFKQDGRERLKKQVTSGQISEGGEKVSHMAIREDWTGRRHSRAQGMVSVFEEQ